MERLQKDKIQRKGKREDARTDFAKAQKSCCLDKRP